MFSTRGYVLTFSRQPNGKTERSGALATEIVVTVWDSEGECIIYQFKPPLISVKNVSISTDQSALCFGGKDTQGRDLILVYSFKDLVREQKIELLGRQLADFELISLTFVEGSS